MSDWPLKRKLARVLAEDLDPCQRSTLASWLAFTATFGAVRGNEQQRAHPAVSVSYGAGMALIIDEFALLLDLKDVYWARQGRISIDLGVGGSAVAGSYLAARPVLRRLARD